MADQPTVAHATNLPYNLIRNLTSPEEKENGVQTWFANVNARDLIEIGTADNLRTYIAEHSASKRNMVHKQIANTIEELPDRFINRNSGITITCTKCEVDDSRRVAKLWGASIINGAQTQGEMKRYFATENGDSVDFPVRVEIVMEPVHEQIVEIAIARNTATSVKSVSQSAARGHLTELKASIESGLPGETIQMRETDEVGSGTLNTQSVLQWTRLLLPNRMFANGAPPHNFAYKQGGKCLADFSAWAQNKGSDAEAAALYDFTVQMAPIAVEEYRYWSSHESWNGHRLHEFGKRSDKPAGGRPIRRDANGKVCWVAPGILFPIMSALSAFVVYEDGKWSLKKPDLFREEELVRRAVQQFRALDREVAVMGRSEAAYDALSIYTDTIATVLREA